MNFKNEILMLRQRIPIGLKQGLQLLEKTNGNLLEAEKLFEKELIALIMV
jgi:hypothetical protein